MFAPKNLRSAEMTISFPPLLTCANEDALVHLASCQWWKYCPTKESFGCMRTAVEHVHQWRSWLSGVVWRWRFEGMTSSERHRRGAWQDYDAIVLSVVGDRGWKRNENLSADHLAITKVKSFRGIWFRWSWVLRWRLEVLQRYCVARIPKAQSPCDFEVRRRELSYVRVIRASHQEGEFFETSRADPVKQQANDRDSTFEELRMFCCFFFSISTLDKNTKCRKLDVDF